MVSDLIKEYFSSPLEDSSSGTVVALNVTCSNEDSSVIFHHYVKRKSCVGAGEDKLAFTRSKARQVYMAVMRVLRENGATRSRLRREDHSRLIVKAVYRAYAEAYYRNTQYYYRIDWEPSREVGDRLSLISESCSPIEGSDVTN